MNASVPYQIPHQPGRWQAVALALLVHAILIGFLWFGISWQNQTPVAVEAEVWNVKSMDAAPKPKAPPPEPVLAPAPAPVPEQKIQTPKPAPAELPKRIEPPAVKAPEIALERERKLKEQHQREQKEAALQREKFVKQEETLKKQKQLQQLQHEKLLAQEKQREQLKLKEQQLQAQAADAAAKKKLEDQKKLATAKASEKHRKDAALEDQKLAAQREENLRRMTASADAGSGGSGVAAKSQGSRADAGYVQKVRAKIKSNTIFNGADELDANPAVEVAVELLPDGSIRRLRKIKSSGVPGFDDAVTRAIEKSQPFPPDNSGSPPSGFTVSYKPKDQ